MLSMGNLWRSTILVQESRATRERLNSISRYISLGSMKEILTKPWLLFKLPRYVRQLIAYRTMERKVCGQCPPLRIVPYVSDAVASQGVGYYFYQDCWAARQIFRERPIYVVDVGSTVLLVGILSQFVRCVSVDIRPVRGKLDGLASVSGSILRLPFGDNRVPCLTTMCVLEHIGLGRYGDMLNPNGTQEAVAEIKRVVSPGGLVVYSVPVGPGETEFNAHRRFSHEQASHLFADWELVDSCLLSSNSDIGHSTLNPSVRGVGCYCLRKPM